MTKFYKSLMAAALVALSALCVQAYDFEEGGLYYNINGENVTLTTGDVTYAGDIVIPATVEHDGVTYNVTAVGTVFKNNTAVTKLVLPSTVTSLPESCFAGMTGLLEVDIPNVENLPNYLVDGCTALTTLTLGEGVHMASSHMTRNCSSLTRVTMLYADVVGWNAPTSIEGSSIPATYKPISNAIQGQSTLYIPFGTTDAYKAQKNTGYGNVTLWNKFGTYVELDPPGGNVDVESITITPENPVLAAEEGATVQLTATVLPEDATDQSIIWSTSDAAVAMVSNSGLVTRTAPLTNDGDLPYTVTITANCANDVVATVIVTAEVLANIQVEQIIITPENPVLAAEEGATVQLAANVLPEDALDKTIIWSSADDAVATVDENGLVTRTAALFNVNDAPYTVDITATAASGVTATITVTANVLETVLPTAISIAPEAPVLNAEAGTTVQLTVNYEPENTTEKAVTWSSADETIASIDQNGLVTRTAPLTSEDEQPYTVVITATTPNGLTANVTVTANVKGDDFFVEDGIYYNVLNADQLTVEVTNSLGGESSDPECYSGDIVIPATVTHKGRTYQVIKIGQYAFASSSSSEPGSPGVTSLTISEGVKVIDAYGVRGMSGISELVLPSSITTLPAFALTRISAETVVIPNVANLDQSTLANCANLKHLTLGEGVKSIGNYLTRNCNALETVTSLATTPPTWNEVFEPFSEAIRNQATLYVPEGCASTYRNISYNGTYYWRFATIEEIVETVLYTITVAEAENGTVEADKTEAEEGETVTLTVTPAEGYELATLTVMEGENEVDVVENTFTMPAGNVTVTATFTEIPPVESAVNFTAQMENGTMTVKVGDAEINSGDAVAAGETVSITVMPAEGYLVESVTVETASESVTPAAGAPARRAAVEVNGSGNEYTFVMPQEPVTINVELVHSPITGINDLRISDNGTIYYDMQGKRIAAPQSGITIAITRNADGTVTTTKIIK
ncbi:MAG: Ig-like domain-containing protein [Muribaculaceae bacterium]|nr:Ig-like domain-containing protein [Muribaculaceae bacterium]